MIWTVINLYWQKAHMLNNSLTFRYLQVVSIFAYAVGISHAYPIVGLTYQTTTSRYICWNDWVLNRTKNINRYGVSVCHLWHAGWNHIPSPDLRVDRFMMLGNFSLTACSMPTWCYELLHSHSISSWHYSQPLFSCLRWLLTYLLTISNKTFYLILNAYCRQTLTRFYWLLLKIL